MWLIWIVFEWAQNFSCLFGGSLSQRATEATRVTRWRKQRRTNYIKNAKIHKFMTCRHGPSFCTLLDPFHGTQPHPHPFASSFVAPSVVTWHSSWQNKMAHGRSRKWGSKSPTPETLPPWKRLELIIHAMSLAASAKGTGKDPF